MIRIGNREGFVLPMAVLLLLVTTGAVMVTLDQGATERRLADGEAGAFEAMVLAETALERFAAEGKSWGWQGGADRFPAIDSGYIRLDDLGADLGLRGHAEVSVHRVRVWASGDSALYVVQARGIRTGGGWAGAPAAVRTVTRVVAWNRSTIDVPSAWTSLGGLLKNGSSGSLDGNDACGMKPAKPGVAVPAEPGYVGHTTPVQGDPPILPIGDTPQEAGDAVNIDWESILNGGITPDYYVPQTAWEDIDFDTWPVVMVTSENFSLPDQGGKGILITPGNLTISGQYLWEGVVLVGNKLTSDGNNTVSGATISGLNVKLGETVPMSDVGNGTKTFEYNSCAVANAMDSFGGALHMMENTWLDSWAGY